jgi:uncharacterized repeat protein (TIGR01451 family)
MKSKLITAVALMALATTTTLWTGCASSRWSDTEESSYVSQTEAASRTEVPRYERTEAQAPTPAPAARPSAVARPTVTGKSSSFDLSTDAVRLTKRCPATADLGATYECDIDVQALTQASGVLVTDTIPNGATYVKSEPAGTLSGNQLSWRLDNLNRGDVRNIKVWLKADKEGSLDSCSTVTAIPQGCLATIVGRPVLAITKTGPAKARIGADVTYTIVVKNTGSAVAKDVVVTDNVPEGLQSAKNDKTLSFSVGDLAAGASRQIPVTLKTTARGRVCNPAVAKSSNAGEVNAEACTVISEPKLEVAKTGTKEQIIGRRAEYQIVVTNPGDESLTDVVVTDTAPSANRIVAAEGASVSGNQATWRIGELKGGDKQSFNVTLSSATPGSYCNRVGVGTAQGLNGNAEACTLWRGVPAVLLETKDDPDPIEPGGTVTYTIRVTNQGTADDKNVRIVAKFSKEIDPMSASSGGSVNGKTVTFAPVPTLSPKQVVTYTITAKGVATGDHRLEVDLTSELLTEPVRHEESTHVY